MSVMVPQIINSETELPQPIMSFKDGLTSSNERYMEFLSRLKVEELEQKLDKFRNRYVYPT